MCRLNLCLSAIALLAMNCADTRANDACYPKYEVVYVSTHQPVVWQSAAAVVQEMGACCHHDPYSGRFFCRQDTRRGCNMCWGPDTECSWRQGQRCTTACPNHSQALTASQYGACCYWDPYSGQYICRQDTENGCTVCWGPGTTCQWHQGRSCSQACPVARRF